MADLSNLRWNRILMILQRSHMLLKRRARVCFGVCEMLGLALIYALIVFSVLMVDESVIVNVMLYGLTRSRKIPSTAYIYRNSSHCKSPQEVHEVRSDVEC